MKKKSIGLGLLIPKTLRIGGVTFYQQYMTDEALQQAVKSYGGITDKPFLSPR